MSGIAEIGPRRLAAVIMNAVRHEDGIFLSGKTWEHMMALDEDAERGTDAQVWDSLEALFCDLLGDEIVTRQLDEALRAAHPHVEAYVLRARGVPLYPVDFPKVFASA